MRGRALTGNAMPRNRSNNKRKEIDRHTEREKESDLNDREKLNGGGEEHVFQGKQTIIT